MSADATLELLGEIYGALDLSVFRLRLLDALTRVLPADFVSLNEIGPAPGQASVIVRPQITPALQEAFARLAHENPLITRWLATHDGRAYRFSDVLSPEELHRREIYRELYAPLGVEHQIAFTLPSSPGQLLGIALSRTGCDFSDAERDLLNRARPFLIQGYRNAVEHTALATGTPPSEDVGLIRLRARGLTERESVIAGWFAHGYPAAAVADALSISPRTVEKHLERAYRKLGVSDREGLVAALG